MLEERTNPKVCPICCSDSITQILCDTLLSAHFRGMSCPSEGVVAFHCSASHVFLLLRSDFKWGEPISSVIPHEIETRRQAAPVRESIMRKLLDPGPSLWLSFGAILGRQRKLQSLGLQP